MHQAFTRLAWWISEKLGTAGSFLVALAIVIVWAATGPLFGFSDSWQLVINTGTTIVTFLMVFLIQATQNRETRALHLKLDELIRVQRRARNLLADIEHATDEELDKIEREFKTLHARAEAQRAAKAAKSAPPRDPH
jgi:low affinity Fe/Cu permease